MWDGLERSNTRQSRQEMAGATEEILMAMSRSEQNWEEEAKLRAPQGVTMMDPGWTEDVKKGGVQRLGSPGMWPRKPSRKLCSLCWWGQQRRKSNFRGESEVDHMRGGDFDGRCFLDIGSDQIQSTGGVISEGWELRTSQWQEGISTDSGTGEAPKLRMRMRRRREVMMTMISRK